MIYSYKYIIYLNILMRRRNTEENTLKSCKGFSNELRVD